MREQARKRNRRYLPVPRAAAPLMRHMPRERVQIDGGLAWFALWTPARGEARAVDALARAGVLTYTPLLAAEVMRRGERLLVTRPAVGRYVFVGMDADAPDFSRLRVALGEDAPRVVEDVFSYTHWRTGQRVVVDVRQTEPPEPLARLLRVRDVPLKVPVKALQQLEDELSLFGHTREVSVGFAKGQDVRVVNGPFEHLLGTVEQVDDLRVKALLDLFGRRSLVEFAVQDLQAA